MTYLMKRRQRDDIHISGARKWDLKHWIIVPSFLEKQEILFISSMKAIFNSASSHWIYIDELHRGD